MPRLRWLARRCRAQLGAPQRAKAFAYGFIVAGTIYLLFDVLIGISLPAAVWGF